MERDRQAPWRTCVQVLSRAGIVLGGAYAWFHNLVWSMWFPGASDETRTWCTIAILALFLIGGFAEYASLRRLRPEPQD